MTVARRRLLAATAATAATALAASLKAREAAAPAAAEQRWLLTSDGVRLNVLSSTPPAPAPDAPTLVLVPGWGMPASLWSAQLEHFGARWRTLAFDPRGQGESEAPDSGYTIERRTDDLRELLAGEREVVLVGWSLAALEALHYVHRFGDSALRALVLVDNSIGEGAPPKPGDLLQRLRADRAAAVERFARSLFTTVQDDARLAAIRRSLLKPRLEQSIALLSYPLPREHWRAIARGFAKPLAYFVTPRWAGQASSLQQHRPGTRIEVFDGAGHALFVDQADRFNAALGGFVATLG